MNLSRLSKRWKKPYFSFSGADFYQCFKSSGLSRTDFFRSFKSSGLSKADFIQCFKGRGRSNILKFLGLILPLSGVNCSNSYRSVEKIFWRLIGQCFDSIVTFSGCWRNLSKRFVYTFPNVFGCRENLVFLLLNKS